MGDYVLVGTKVAHFRVPWRFRAQRGRVGPAEPDILEVPGDLEIVPEKAFFGWKARTLVIPKTVRVIERWAFAGMRGLRKVRFERGSALERVEPGAFMDTNPGKVDFPRHATVAADWKDAEWPLWYSPPGVDNLLPILKRK